MLSAFLPVARALEPCEDVSAAGVIHLIVRVCVRLLHSDRVTVKTHTIHKAHISISTHSL